MKTSFLPFSLFRALRSFLVLMCILALLVLFGSILLPSVHPEEVFQESLTLCSEPSPVPSSSGNASHSPLIYIITPTYTRREQVAELTRLGQTLLHLRDIHWILSEDAEECSDLVRSVLLRFGIPHTHLISPMPRVFLKDKYKPRGVSNRRSALKWISQNHPPSREAVLYFADDDNTYDLRLFPQIRSTQRVSMFPVGLIGSIGYSSPIVSHGKVIGFSDDWFARRKYPVDMAGFAVNVAFLIQRGGGDMPYKPGHEEDRFLNSLGIELQDITPLANNCTEILVWHTKTVSEGVPKLKPKRKSSSSSVPSSLDKLLEDLAFKNMISLSSTHRAKDIPLCYKKSCPTNH